MAAEMSPVMRLRQLADELQRDALVADATGEDHVKVGHEWASELAATASQIPEHRTGRQNWADTALPAKVVITAVAIALSAIALAVGWVALDNAWDRITDDEARSEPVRPPADTMMYGPLDRDLHEPFETLDDCLAWAEAEFEVSDPALDCAPTA